jgi:hypothetical protein
MAAPSQQDVAAVLRSQEYYRLKRAIESPGDIFEINESAKAIYIGPDSDIGEVQITYFDPNVPLSLQTAQVSVNGPFVGRIDSLPKTKVSSTGQPARILVSPTDIVDNAYAVPLSNAFRSFNVPAVIDLIFALQGLPDIPQVRADRTLRFPNVPYENIPVASDDGSTDLIVPIYGRRMVTITIASNQGVAATVSLVTLQAGGSDTVPRLLGTFESGVSIPATNQTASAVYRASDAARSGMTWDETATPTGFYLESDATTLDPSAFNPAPRGMADLMVINITKNNASMTPGTRYADVFIKIADRET